MKVFVVAVPLFDASMAVSAYLLRDRSGNNALDIKNDYRGITEALLSPGLDVVEQVGLEAFAADKPLFAEINRFQLLAGMPSNMQIDPTKLICILPKDLPAGPDELGRCHGLQQCGYTLALSGYPENGMDNAFIPYVQYILLDYKAANFAQQYRALQNELPKVQLIVTNIPSQEAYQTLSKNSNALFSGDFYSQPITAGISSISPVKVNALQLLREVNQDDFELIDIAKIIERDPALSISLLKFINSGAVGLQRKIDSITSAVAILGQHEVRRWATVAISVSLAEDRPGEITKLALVRAKFAENLAGAFELGVFQHSLFMTGLFSLLDVILQKPMEEAILEVAVDDRVKRALVDKGGDLFPVLALIYLYERADWDNVSILMIRNGVDIEQLNQAFTGALVWYQQLLQSIDSM